MKLTDIIDKIDINNPQEFYDFTNKWINFVTSKKQSSDISDDDWQHFFTHSNPVAGIDRGEMLDKAMIPTKEGKEEKITNERNSFRNKWDSDIRPKIEDIINTKNESEKITKAKELSQLILQIIKDGGGRKMQVAINRILATFFPDLFVSIPNHKDLIKFIEKLNKVVDDGTEIIKSDNWIDNSYQVKRFLDKELDNDNLTASAWRFYDYLKGDKSEESNQTIEDSNANIMNNESKSGDFNNTPDATKADKNKPEDFLKLLSGNYNLILTGAPGTGKTYLAKQIAMEMGATEENGACKLVQFHPSYDYTDFVEGLRPIKEGDKLGFQRKDGVFKEFCKKATTNTGFSFDDAYDRLIQDIQSGDLRTIKLKTKDSAELEVRSGNNIGWYSETEEGNKSSNVVSKDRLKKLFDIYNTLQKLEELSNINEGVQSIIGGCDSTYYWGVLHHILENYVFLKPYVFIIDEINRGEISKIFGELFYSIDPGYRGEKGKVNTQYQNLIDKNGDDVFKDGFYVPKNVYIIGTMNDIDRSVESMDFAMRRRFAWKEITAKSRQPMLNEDDAWGGSKPTQTIIDEIKIRMDNLNAAIIDNYDYGFELSPKDRIGLTMAYQIGAAYFLKYALYSNSEDPFEDLWTNHLKGLLYEYLRGTTDIDSKIDRLHQAYNDTIQH